MDTFTTYAALFVEAQTECDEHRREMCRIVTTPGSDQKLLTQIRTSILKYRAKSPKKAPEMKELPVDKTSLLQIFELIKTQAERFAVHDRLVDTIAGNLKDETYTLSERLNLICHELM